MSALDQALSTLDGIMSETVNWPALDPRDQARRVLETRSRVIAQVSAIHDCSATDPRLVANPDHAHEFREKLGDLRRRLAGLQAKWRAEVVAADFKNYATESGPIAGAIVDFVKWARTARKA